MSRQTGRYHKRTMKNFYEAYGHGPWECHWCDEPVTQIGQHTWDGNVHHLDHDVTNDDPSNLAIGHTVCHLRTHAPDEEMRGRISQTLKGRPSPTRGMRFAVDDLGRRTLLEQGAYIPAKVRIRKKTDFTGENNPFFGKSHSEESLAKMRGPRPHVTHSRPHTEESKAKLRGARHHEVCEDCGKDWAGAWIVRHKREGLCNPNHKKQRQRRVN